MSIPNYYKFLDNGTSDKKPYKNFDKIKIQPVERWSIYGSSGSGKNNALIYIITQMDCWDEIFICCRHPDQKLLKVMQSAGCHLTDDINTLPKLEDIPLDGKMRCFVFDDMQQTDKATLAKITDLYTRARHKKVCIISLFQNFYSSPKTMRGNSTIIILQKILSVRDLKMILSEYSITDVSTDAIMNLYNKIKERSQMDFLLIDLVNNDPSYKFRHNFNPVRLV